MAIFLGASAGPLVGGVIADLVGRRVNFFVTSALLLAAGVIVSRFAQDNFTPPKDRKSILRSMVPDLSPLASSPALVSLVAVIAADQVAGSITNPFLPLIVQKLSPGSALIGSTTGLVLGCGAVSSALAAFVIGKVSYRFGYRRSLIVCMVGAAVFLIPQAFARTWLQLLLLRIASGFFVGGNLPSANALIAQQAEKGKQGSIYGLSSSVASASNSVGPVIGAGIAMGIGLNAVFIATAAILASAGGAIMAFIRPQRGSRLGDGDHLGAGA
jgi:DHA1 family multidrug resistance protein-like MFS transporter